MLDLSWSSYGEREASRRVRLSLSSWHYELEPCGNWQLAFGPRDVDDLPSTLSLLRLYATIRGQTEESLRTLADPC